MFLALLPTLGSVQSSGVIVGVLLPVVGKVLYFLPSAVLASTIIISVASLIDVATAKRLWRQDKGDFSVSFFCNGFLVRFVFFGPGDVLMICFWQRTF